MNRYLITGGTGFIGANVIRRLISMNKNVYLLVRKECNMWRIKDINKSLNIYVADLLDRNKVEKAVQKIKPDIIFHFAIYGAYSFQQDVNRMFQTNVLGTINLINACRRSGFKLFINPGTSSEYGFKGYAPSETATLEPNSYYAVSKACVTQYCNYIGRAHELPIITFRLYSVYGPHEEPTRFIPTLINYALRGKLPWLVSPQTARDFIYVDDVIDAYIKAVNYKSLSPGEIYNLGSGRQTTVKDVVNITKKILNINAKPNWNTMEARTWDTDKWVANIRKIKKELNWKPQYTLLKGLEKTIDWFQQSKDFYKDIYKYNIGNRQ